MKCSIYHVNCSHTAELEQLIAKHHQPANHDQLHYVFVSEYVGDDRTSTPINVDELGFEGDSLVWYIAQILATDVDAVLHLDIRTADMLHKHPAWRIWCANYAEDQIELFKSDWDGVENAIVGINPAASTLWPEYNDTMTYIEGREVVFNAIMQALE